MLQLPIITVQLPSMLKPFQNHNPSKSKSCNKNLKLLTKHEVTLRPFTCEKIECEPEGEWKNQEINGVLEPSRRLETSLNLCLRHALCNIQDEVVKVGIMNLKEHNFTVPKDLILQT